MEYIRRKPGDISDGSRSVLAALRSGQQYINIDVLADAGENGEHGPGVVFGSCRGGAACSVRGELSGNPVQ